MNYIWNPLHGCKEKDEGCKNCYAKSIDVKYGRDFYECKKNSSQFYLPLQKEREGNYKIEKGATLRVCMNCDFFYGGLDEYRDEVWNIMRQRNDIFYLIFTKYPERINECLPKWWDKDEMLNVIVAVSCATQKEADERLPLLESAPFVIKGLSLTPLLEEISIDKYLNKNFISFVNCGGENHNGHRECRIEWVNKLSQECYNNKVKFTFTEIGNNFITAEGKISLKSRHTQGEIARAQHFNNLENLSLYGPSFTPTWYECCKYCGTQPICCGCGDGKGTCG